MNKISSFLLWQICQFNHYGWLILLKFDWFLNSNSQNLLLAFFLIRPILDPKFPLMAVAEKARWHNRKDEAYILLSLYLSLSLELIFHLDGLTFPNEVWIKLESLFEKQDDIRGNQLENELISLRPSEFETIEKFITKFKSRAFENWKFKMRHHGHFKIWKASLIYSTDSSLRRAPVLC